MSEKTFSLTDNATGKAVQLKGYAGTMGPDVIDVRSIYAQDGRFTYDPGFASTASCESAITGQFNSFAKPFKLREISEISVALFSPGELADIN